MSQPQALPRSAPAGRRGPGSSLHLVPAPRRPATRWPFALACAALLGTALLGILALNITLSHGAFERHDLSIQQARLAEAEQRLAQQNAVEGSPQRVAERARTLGMIPSAATAFLQADGSVTGAPAAAITAALPSLVPVAAAVIPDVPQDQRSARDGTSPTGTAPAAPASASTNALSARLAPPSAPAPPPPAPPADPRAVGEPPVVAVVP